MIVLVIIIIQSNTVAYPFPTMNKAKDLLHARVEYISCFLVFSQGHMIKGGSDHVLQEILY